MMKSRIIGYDGLAKLLGYSKSYVTFLKSKSPERLPPPIRTSKTKWHIDVVNEWLKEQNNKIKIGRPRKYN